MSGIFKKALSAVALAGAAALALAACTSSGAPDSGSTAGGDGGAEGNVSLTVHATNLVMDAPIRAALEAGAFEEAGIDLELYTGAQSPAEAMPLLLNGTIDMAVAEVYTAMLGHAEGMPLRIVTPIIVGTEGESTDMGFVNLMVRDDGSVNSPADLVGKSVGVNGIGEQPWMQSREALRMAGVDPEQVSFVAIPFNQQVAALQQGQVDAVVVPEPMGTMAMAAGAKPLITVDNTFVESARYSYVTTEQVATEKAEALASFNDIVLEYAEKLNTDTDLRLATAQTYVELPDPAILEAMVYPTYATNALTANDLEVWGQQIQEAGLIEDATTLPGADDILLK